ncbi:MAG: LamG domain-containing protein [Bacteroidetes bacterium]|nr:LamG domain-containing protein [Bacteroidota bacterium]
MKKQLLLTTIVLALNFAAFSQKWLNFPSGTTNNRIDIGDLSVIGDSITVEALVTMQSTTYIPDAYDIVSKHSNAYDCSYLFRPDNFAIKTITDGFVGIANPLPLCMDSTYHVAGTYDGDSIKFFVNGKQVAAQHWTGTLFQNNYVVGIGNLTYTLGFNEQFTGYIDEVRIWGTARSQADISNNMYDLPNPTSQPGLLAYYKFNGDYKNAQETQLLMELPMDQIC